MKIIYFDNKVFKNIYIFSKQHTHHYMTAYRMFLDNKVIGVGVKNFRNFCSNEKYEISGKDTAEMLDRILSLITFHKNAY